MCASSGKARDELFGYVHIDARIQTDLSSIEFGEVAEALHERTIKLGHMEHSLAYYSTGLPLETN